MKVVILMAGEGTRMRPLTLTLPKPLIDVSGKTIAERIFNSLPDQIDEVILIVDYLKEKIVDYFGEKHGGRKISYINQIEKKGTFCAILSAKDLISKNERFLVLNGDDIHDKEELSKYLAYPRSFGIQKMIMPNYYSVLVDEKESIAGFSKQTEEEKTNGVLVATGAYVLDSNIFEHEGVVVFGGEYGLPQTILAQKDQFPIKAVITKKWIPINSFDDLDKARKIFL